MDFYKQLPLADAGRQSMQSLAKLSGQSLRWSYEMLLCAPRLVMRRWKSGTTESGSCMRVEIAKPSGRKAEMA